MTRDDILRMAREAGFQDRDGTIRTMHSSGAWVGINEELERFAALVAAAERERWHDVIFDGWRVLQGLDERAQKRTSHQNVSDTLDAVARVMEIRARGTK